MDRPLPLPDPDTAFFWEATARRTLQVLRCHTCTYYVHLPRPACNNCGSTDLAPATVSGRGTIHSYTVTHQRVPGYEPPFNVILVDLEEQAGLRVVSNLLDAEPRIGMEVEVFFQPIAEDVWLPLFKPRSDP